MSTSLTRAMARRMFLPILVVAVGIFVKGYAAVGDGFSAGMIASMALLLQFLVWGNRDFERYLPLNLARLTTSVGLLLTLAVTFVPVLFGHPFLSHFPAPDEHVTRFGALELHTAVLFDLGVFLLVFGFTISTARTLAGAATGEA